MNRRLFTLVALGCVVAGGSAEAQIPQVVQLPTFRSFSISTTVVVPDRGAAYLGGVSRSAQGRTSRGVPGLSQLPVAGRLFSNRGIGSSISSSHAYATARIIDHAEMDRMILDEAAARRGPLELADKTDERAAFLSKHVARRPAMPIARPVAADERVAAERHDGVAVAARLAEANAQQEAEMASYLQRAEAAEAAGRLGAARCCYSVLVRRGSERQQRLAAERLAALQSPPAAVRLAGRE